MGGSKISFPRWVRVTWRTPIPGHFTATTGKVVETLDFGDVIGDYKVEVLSRIPAEVFTYAAARRGRAIVLRFRLKDDGVLLAWDVQESYGGSWAFSLHGGDFPCDPVTPYMTRPNCRCTEGYLQDTSWYHP